jgi:hypothetical protein
MSNPRRWYSSGTHRATLHTTSKKTADFARPHDISPQKMLLFRKEFQLATQLLTLSLHVLQFSNVAFIKSDNLERMWYAGKWRLILNTPPEYLGD